MEQKSVLASETSLSELERLKKIIDKKEITINYQPIINLDNASVFGYEALCRGPVNSSLHSPVNLFETAERNGFLYTLESLVRELSIRRFRELELSAKLFLNLNSRVINEPGFAKGQTRRLVHHLGLKSCQVVFEITERNSIKDFPGFRKALEHYRKQGFLVAIDDAGAGYSSIQAIAEIQPDFIKIDMSLIRNVDKDRTKQAVLETLVTLAGKINSSLIAEGIETYEELAVIKGLGIGLGQGFYLGFPSPDPVKSGSINSPGLKKLIGPNYHLTNVNLKPLLTPVMFVPDSALNKATDEMFSNHPQIKSVVVTNRSRPVGVIVKEKFYRHLDSHHDPSQFLTDSVTSVMDKNPVIIKANLSLTVICQLITYKKACSFDDFALLADDGYIIGAVPIHLVFLKYINTNIEKGRLL